ncbi:MAG: DUF305 domain-containing protein [Acidobacteriota bacterium]|nr:MAG: DUF305 domain-containing protein [Acidobacteriota bacterium]
MVTNLPHASFLRERRAWKIRVLSSLAASLCLFAATGTLASLPALRVCAQEPSTPVVVQPGAPGKPTKVLPPTTRAKLPPVSTADVQFMQGMITHHEQAVEMTDLIESRTGNREVRSLGVRISRSQADEIRFMKRWLLSRGQAPPKPNDHSHHMHMAHGSMELMPGMLSPEQMEALRKAKGEEFDRLFLKGMIQHHDGALIMVKDLFDTAGAGQDAELFNFATDVDSGQRAEIRVMQNMLEKLTSGEKR